ncbi:MAG: DUF1552 domain-containing protein [Planctomycetota bacterium]|nr:DUF1552 domain-containing protein [Planctomycetota bacterium]
MSRRPLLSRRAVLRGLGTAVALPWLEAMGAPWLAPREAAAGDAASAPPRRMAYVFFPNGAHMQDWTPTKEGADYELPWILEPLEAHKRDLLVLSGLAQDQARAHGDGPGDHARCVAVFLTGAHPVKTKGANIRVGVSVDQVAARAIGGATRFASVELGIEPGRQSGNCDSGYSCAYSTNMSWRTPTTPVAKEINPRLVFERLFNDGKPGETKEARDLRLRRRKSVLDFVGRDAKQLRGRLGGADRAKLEEYLEGLRDVERRIEKSEQERADALGAAAEFPVPAGIPGDRREHMRLMCDLLVLAFQTDTTRVATFMLGNGGSNATFPWIGVRGSHHGLSHHGGDKGKIAAIRKINRFHVSQYAYLLEKLKSVKEGEGTLLDSSMVVFGSGIADGNRHNHDNLPVLLAGGGGGSLRTGRHVRYPRWTPLNNLYLSMLERVGVHRTALGDSTGPLEKLA